MGLSGSSSTSNTSQTQNTNQTENATTTPVTPDFLTQAATDYVGRIGAFGQQDPNSFVAPSSPLQNMAWQNASSLGDWRQQAATAAGMAQQAGYGAPNLAGAPQMPQQMSGKFSGQPQHTSELPLPADPSQRGGLVSGAGYSMPPAQPGYAQARTGYPIGQGPAFGYNPSTATPAQVAQTPGATASSADPASLLTNLSSYQDPYMGQVRDAALSDFDTQAAQQRAQMEAQGAANGAFGGSRFGLAQGQLLADQGRSRASLDAGLLDQGFNTAAQLSQADAANRQQASLFNAQNQTGVSQFNSGQDAARAMADAGYGQQAGLANQASYDAAGQFNAGANNQMSQFNATQADNALNRQLQSAGLIGGLANDYGAGTRADLATMAQLGDQQRGVEQAYDMSGPAQLQMMGNLSGMTPYQILVGQNVNGTNVGQMTGTGAQTVTQSPSLFSSLLSGAGAVGAFF